MHRACRFRPRNTCLGRVIGEMESVSSSDEFFSCTARLIRQSAAAVMRPDHAKPEKRHGSCCWLNGVRARQKRFVSVMDPQGNGVSPSGRQRCFSISHNGRGRPRKSLEQAAERFQVCIKLAASPYAAQSILHRNGRIYRLKRNKISMRPI